MSDYIHIPSSDFPSDILKWMKIKANPKMLLKLMKCCKYFQHFPEFPFFVVKEAFYDGDPRPSSFTTLNDEMYLMEEEYIKNNDKKIWVTNDFGIYDPKLVFSTILPKYAVFDIRFLVLYHQKLSFEELKILTASGTIEKMNFEDTIFKSENGKQVFIDSILECVPNLASLR
uniref:F-box domain-containing protein n=1 Tax=Panagrolaimus davidi TaxID=227884 RepID=A0A914Q5D9_9BILA